METICKVAIEKYQQTGETHIEGSATITGFEDFDIWMSARSFNYTIDISTKIFTKKFLCFEKTKTEYTLKVSVFDRYDYNSGTDKEDGLGSWLNNFAYSLHEKGIGTDYDLSVTYTKKYNASKKWSVPYRSKIYPFCRLL